MTQGERLAALTKEWLTESEADDNPLVVYTTRAFVRWLSLRGAFDLDEERLTRALVIAFPFGAFDLSHPSAAAAIAKAYKSVGAG